MSSSKSKNVLLVTENKTSEFSRKVIRAARLAKKKLTVEEAKFTTLSKILEGEIGVIIVDRDELSGVGDHFFRAIRMFRSHTPVLMPFSKKLILEQMFTRAYEREVTTAQLAKIMVKAAQLGKEADKALPMTYSFERDIKLERLAELIVKSLQFDKALKVAEKKFSVRLKKIQHLTGDKLTSALQKIRKEAFSSPEFKHLRAEMMKKAQQIREESLTVH